jgi:hypothetical protein
MFARHRNNLTQIATVADRLGELREKVVFLGGAVVGLLITDPAVGDVRRTLDVDLVIDLVGLAQFADVEDTLRRLKFKHDLSEGAPTCRYIVDDIIVDIMPLNGESWGFDMTWHSLAFQRASTHNLQAATGSLPVRVINAPLFLATKIAAFSDRGNSDYMESDDISDIIHVLNGRPELFNEMAEESLQVRQFISNSFKQFLEAPAFLEAISPNLLPDDASQQRESIIMHRMTALIL